MFFKKFRLYIQTLVIYFIDPFFKNRVPNRFFIYVVLLLSPVIRLFQPNDRWNIIAFLSDWVKLLSIEVIPKSPKPKRIFILSCYRGQYTHDIVLSILLAWRGHHIVIGYFPKLRSPIKDPLYDNPGTKEYVKHIFEYLEKKSCGKIICIDLSDIDSDASDFDEDFVLNQARADAVMRTRQEQLSLDNDDVKFSISYYENLGKTTQPIARAFFLKNINNLDLCLLANGASFESAYFCHEALRIGMPVTTYEKFAFNNVKIITHGAQFYQFNDIERIWNRREELGLLEELTHSYVINKAWDLLNQRKNTTGNNWGWQYQKNASKFSEESLHTDYGITKNKFILVCPNIPFDAGYAGWMKPFSSMREWLVKTIIYLLNSSNDKIIIRAHPAEARPGFGEEKIANILKDENILSERICVLPGDSKVNTYDLMPLCKFAIVFASTVGIELAMHGKLVLSGANVYYNKFGITISPDSKNNYFKCLSNLINDRIDDYKVNSTNAALVYFIFHYLLQWRYPYDKPSQISMLPLKKIVCDPLIDNYIETFDLMAMNENEYECALPHIADISLIKSRWNR